jgi:hypothetical protein
MRKSILAVLLLSMVAAMVCKVAEADQPQIPDVYAALSAEPDRRGTAQQPLVISKPVEDRNREWSEEAAHARNELIMMLATVLLTIFTGALWLINIWLIKDARRVSTRQAQDTQRAIAEQTRSADAMQEVATATRNNATLMSGMLTKQMRAYVQVNIGSATAQRGELKFASIPEIINVGLTPAKKVSYRVMADVLDSNLPANHVFPEPEQIFSNDATLNARQTFKINAIVKNRFDAAEVAEVSKGLQKRLFVWGTITYDDVFEGHWETKFCHNFVFFDSSDPETGKTLHRFNSYYFSGHNSTT